MPRADLLRALARGVGGVVVGAAVGALVGVLGSVVHQAAWGGARWPVGIVLALGLTASFAGCLRACTTSVPTRGAALVVWALVILQAAGRRSEGDVLVPGNARGYAFLLGAFVVLTALLVFPPRGSRVRRS